ncbi:MAG: tRNA guanosine(34) transglycosylase Tgt [Helicobacter sp.]|nr:tRNA guanosine(34) transglycosylase Tgt [Helicobacter sp.]
MRITLDSSPALRERALTLQTAHSTIETPVFMPVGTQASVKALDSLDMRNLGAHIILANTYHLYLRPGAERVAQLGGLHGFCNFPHSFLTDSGGFQAFSLAQNVRYVEDGIVFKSHIDGSKHLFTPDKVLEIQYLLNSDIMMVLDDLIALPAPRQRIEQSIARTIDWARQSFAHHKRRREEGATQGNNIFAIVQGGTDKLLRKVCAESLCELDFDGYALGGLSVGEPNLEMYATIAHTAPILPHGKPRYLMGVGTPEDLIEGIAHGIDMFDCVMPTRNARNGTLFVREGRLSIKAAIHKDSPLPIEPDCTCHTCTHHTRAYLHHLFKAKELSYYRLASIHNLHYYLELVRAARRAILAGSFRAFRAAFYAARNAEIPQYDGCVL